MNTEKDVDKTTNFIVKINEGKMLVLDTKA